MIVSEACGSGYACTMLYSMHLKDRNINFWKENFYDKYKGCNEGKFFTYVAFKDRLCYEPYLDVIHNRDHRVSFTKLRNHHLSIEKGRYSRPVVPRDERWCPHCLSKGLKNIEDEIHFLCSCNPYSNLRLNLSNAKLGFKNHPSQDKLFLYLLTTEGLSVIFLQNFVQKHSK
jgi:hypothetical protein